MRQTLKAYTRLKKRKLGRQEKFNLFHRVYFWLLFGAFGHQGKFTFTKINTQKIQILNFHVPYI